MKTVPDIFMLIFVEAPSFSTNATSETRICALMEYAIAAPELAAELPPFFPPPLTTAGGFCRVAIVCVPRSILRTRPADLYCGMVLVRTVSVRVAPARPFSLSCCVTAPLKRIRVLRPSIVDCAWCSSCHAGGPAMGSNLQPVEPQAPQVCAHM